MTKLQGMIVRLQTKNQSGAGTDDHIYIGVVGKGGGREFPLAVKNFNDFERGADVVYWLGTVWDGTAVVGARKSHKSTPGGRNNPGWFDIEIDDVEYVYIRKQGERSTSGDDAYKFDSVRVTLYGTSPQQREFFTGEDLWLANEYGLQAWIPES